VKRRLPLAVLFLIFQAQAVIHHYPIYHPYPPLQPKGEAIDSLAIAPQHLTTLAISPIQVSGTDTAAAVLLEAEISNTFVSSHRFRLLERQELNEILKEQAFDATTCHGNDCGTRIGRLLGVEEILLGRLAVYQGVWAFSMRRVDVATGKVLQDLTAEFADLASVRRFVESKDIFDTSLNLHGHDLHFKETLPFGIELGMAMGIESGNHQLGTHPILSPQLTLLSKRLIMTLGAELMPMNPKTKQPATIDGTIYPIGSSGSLIKARLSLGYDLVRTHRYSLCPSLGLVDGFARLQTPDSSSKATEQILAIEPSIRFCKNWWSVRGRGNDGDVAGASMVLDAGWRHQIIDGAIVPKEVFFVNLGLMCFFSFL